MSFIKRLLRKVLIPIFPELRPKTKRTLTEKFSALREFQLNAPSHQWKHLLYHNELCQLVENVPGDFAEFGVAGGTTFISLARILDVKDAGKSPAETRHVYGFDSFEGLPALDDNVDVGIKQNDEMVQGGYYDPKGNKELFEYVKNKENLHLIKGWFNETLPPFLQERSHISFSLIHMDADLYSSTLEVLKNIWPHVSPGGIIVFDELFNAAFPGETEAFREFFEDKAGKFELTHSEYRRDKKILRKFST